MWGSVSSGFCEIEIGWDRLGFVGLLAPFLAPTVNRHPRGRLGERLCLPEPEGPIYSRISAKVVSTPEPSVLHPTPMQVVLRHETPNRELKAAPEGFEVP
jgi:hypothetical protein